MLYCRGHVKSHYQIETSCCLDCLAGWCCPVCNLVQLSSHVETTGPPAPPSQQSMHV